jgi:hypothetical protein
MFVPEQLDVTLCKDGPICVPARNDRPLLTYIRYGPSISSVFIYLEENVSCWLQLCDAVVATNLYPQGWATSNQFGAPKAVEHRCR